MKGLFQIRVRDNIRECLENGDQGFTIFLAPLSEGG